MRIPQFGKMMNLWFSEETRCPTVHGLSSIGYLEKNVVFVLTWETCELQASLPC